MSKLAGPIGLGELHLGRLQTKSDVTPFTPSAVKAIDPPSGDTATLTPSVSFVGEPPSIDTIQIDAVPSAIEVYSTNRSSGVTVTCSAVTEGAKRVFRRPLASALQRSR